MSSERRLDVGPSVRDFRAAFGVGTDGDEIDLVDGVGVALAAIQGLHKLVEEHALDLAELSARLDRAEAG